MIVVLPGFKGNVQDKVARRGRKGVKEGWKEGGQADLYIHIDIYIRDKKTKYQSPSNAEVVAEVYVPFL